MEILNFWYYTLSFVSQTLAAIIALSATFVIFKLDQLQRQKKDYIDKMFRFMMILDYKIDIHETYEKLKNDDGIKELLKPIDDLTIDEDDLGFGKIFKKRKNLTSDDAKDVYGKNKLYMGKIIYDVHGQHKSTNKRILGYLKYQKQYFFRILEVKSRIFLRLKFSLLLNSSTIVLSLALIPFFESFVCYSYKIICLIILLASISIFYTAQSMWKISNDEI